MCEGQDLCQQFGLKWVKRRAQHRSLASRQVAVRQAIYNSSVRLVLPPCRLTLEITTSRHCACINGFTAPVMSRVAALIYSLQRGMGEARLSEQGTAPLVLALIPHSHPAN